MKGLAGVAALLLGLSAVFAAPLEVMTFNIRYDNPDDGANAWPNRKSLVAGVFKDHAVDLAGLQEALDHQIADLHRLLPGYGWLGVGRDDGRSAGEYAPIFYRRDRFEVLRHGTFWISETPDRPGKPGWDAACPRIATWAVFRRKSDGREIFLLNTHLDHRGKVARERGARLIASRIADLRGTAAVIVTGDFNSGEKDKPAKGLARDAGLQLASRVSVDRERGATTTTFQDFGESRKPAVIDHILVGPGVGVFSCKYLPIVRGGVFVSDHWPVLCRLDLP